jgi:hypothetical protein
MNNKKLIGVGLLSVLGLIGVVLLVYAAVVNCGAGCSGTTVIPNGNRYHEWLSRQLIRFTPTMLMELQVPATPPAGTTSSVATLVMTNIYGCLGNDTIYGGDDDDDHRR